MKTFFVYILKCRDDSYYVGHTNNVELRVAQHNEGNYCEYTNSRRPVKAVFVQTFPTRDQAFAMEQRIKKWSRAKKKALIDNDWLKLKELSKKKFK